MSQVSELNLNLAWSKPVSAGYRLGWLLQESAAIAHGQALHFGVSIPYAFERSLEVALLSPCCHAPYDIKVGFGEPHSYWCTKCYKALPPVSETSYQWVGPTFPQAALIG